MALSTSREPLVSVVTPLYNGAETLRPCIESVLAQTYRNFEHVIVNNRSTDRSLEIAREYAARDHRIRIVDNATFVEAAENHDIAFRAMAPGSAYCKVVHADDWIFPECLARMVEVAEANPSVSVVSAYRLEETDVTLDGLPYPSTVVSGREICRLALLGQVYVFGTPTSLLIRSDVVRGRDPFYDAEEFPRHFDTAVCYELLKGRDLGFVHQVLTFTRRGDTARLRVSRRLGSARPEHLAILRKYGGAYLTRQEYERRHREMVRNYYHFLGRCLLQSPGSEFWSYHRQFLRRLGLSNSLARILGGTLGAAMESLFRPLSGLSRALHPDSGAR
jgi:glycosyltransferase involved in cell wall biosynthesis